MKIIVDNTTCNKYLINPSSQTFAPKILLLIIFLIVVVKCTINTPVYAQDISEVPNVKKGYPTTSVDKYMPSGATEDEPPLILPASDGRPVRELDGSLPVDLEGDQDEKQNILSETSIRKSIAVTYDIERGEEIIITRSSTASNSNDVSIHEPSNEIPKNNYMNGGRGEEIDSLNQTTQDEPRSFTGLSLVPAYALTSYPYRVAVKIKTFKTDTAGNHWYASCSGTLIDPTHVITAGHCVYSHGDSSAIFNDWAEAIIIVPAYRETSTTSNPWADVYWDSSGNPQFPNYDYACRDEPYGCAKAIHMHTFSGWTDYEDFDYDIAVIELDRPVGSLSGWAGYGWNSSCSHFTNNFFRHSGYPAESPYNGGDMYTFYGNFDSCESYDNQIRYYRPSWGGQSGSGAIDDPNSCPNCQVNAILSNSDFANTYTDDVILTEDSYTSIRGWIDTDTYSSVDLVPINVRASSSVVAGQRITGMDYLVHNYSNAIYNGILSVNVYLSTDDNITSSDTLIQSNTVTTTLEPKSSIRVAASTGPLVPSGFAGGTYYLGIIIENYDANTDNNATDGQDTAIISVGGSNPVCNRANLDACTIMSDCQRIGGYWYDSVCNATPYVPPLVHMPIPTNQYAWSYPSIENPIIESNPADCKPFAVGDLSSGNLNLQIGLPQVGVPIFSLGVDIYLALQSDALSPGTLFVIDSNNNILPASTTLPRWKTNVFATINESLYGDIPTSLLPVGLYNLYVALVPSGETDFSHYYFWSTSFSISD